MLPKKWAVFLNEDKLVKDKVEKIEKCRLCGDGVKVVSKLALTPVGDRFLKNIQNAKEFEFHNVELALCRSCGQIQLSEVVEPAQVYDDEYLYTTAVSYGLPEHFRQSAKEICERFLLDETSLVVEIGSNEGIMLEAFKERSVRVLGIDPAKIAVDKANERGIETIHDFFTEDLAKKIKQEKGSAKVIIANNVIANIPDLKSVVISIKELLADDGVFVFETSYAVDVVGKQLIDTIYHEHISYLSAKPLESFFDSCGLNFFDAEYIKTKGGSLRGFVVKKESLTQKNDNLIKLIENELASGIFEFSGYMDFDKNLEKLKQEIISICEQLKRDDKKVVVYGASVGCVMMIYQFGLEKYIDFIVDDNPSKIDRYCPGVGSVVYDSMILENGGIGTVISLAWRFMEPITKRHEKFLENGGEFLVVNLPDAKMDRIKK